MSKKRDPRNRTFLRPQQCYKAWLDGHSFVPHTAELLASQAWQNRSRYAMRLIDHLELEHARHNGLENGHLRLTYRQMQKAGIHANYIAATLAEVVALGLVTITHRGSYRGGARNDPSTYRLNYLPWRFVPAVGPPVYYAPLDEWISYVKPTPQKSVRMPLTDGATNYQSGGASEVHGEVAMPSDPAEMTPSSNATVGWKRSSKLRSTRRSGGMQDPSSC
jgi:hypothetical protein